MILLKEMKRIFLKWSWKALESNRAFSFHIYSSWCADHMTQLGVLIGSCWSIDVKGGNSHGRGFSAHPSLLGSGKEPPSRALPTACGLAVHLSVLGAHLPMYTLDVCKSLRGHLSSLVLLLLFPVFSLTFFVVLFHFCFSHIQGTLRKSGKKRGINEKPFP